MDVVQSEWCLVISNVKKSFFPFGHSKVDLYFFVVVFLFIYFFIIHLFYIVWIEGQGRY